MDRQGSWRWDATTWPIASCGDPWRHQQAMADMRQAMFDCQSKYMHNYDMYIIYIIYVYIYINILNINYWIFDYMICVILYNPLPFRSNTSQKSTNKASFSREEASVKYFHQPTSGFFPGHDQPLCLDHCSSTFLRNCRQLSLIGGLEHFLFFHTLRIHVWNIYLHWDYFKLL